MKNYFLFLWVSFFWMSGCVSRTVKVNDPSFFPMSKGTCWAYRGVLDEEQSGTREISVQVSVLDTYSRGLVTIALLSDFPTQIPFYSKEKKSCVLLRSSLGRYHLLAGDRWDELLKRLKDDKDPLVSLTDGSSLLIDAPFAQGKTYGEWESLSRNDHGYCWYVDSIESIHLNGISGVSGILPRQQISLLFQTCPDIQKVEFVPGIGITHFEYTHHGTIHHVDLKLVGFKIGKLKGCH